MSRRTFALLVGLVIVGVPAPAQVVQGGGTSGLNRVFDFNSVPNPRTPWTPYVTLTAPGVVIGERLVGQTTTPSGVYEIVSGTPRVPLTMDGSVLLTTGVSVFTGQPANDLDLGPEGTAGWPSASSLGEGSFTVLYELDQKTVGLSIGYANLANQAQALFYDRSGALIGSLVVAHPPTSTGEVPVAFSVKSGPWIAAMTVNNTDAGGLGYDDLRYAYAAILLSGSPAPGGTVTLALSMSADAGLGYQIGSAFGAGPTPIGNRFIGLSVDDLLVLSVSGFLPGTFVNYPGRLDASGKAQAQLRIPGLPALRGLRIHSAFVTLDPQMPSGIRTISATAMFSIQ
jgi:hypothetical protein